jgi:hypothetical protein
MALPVNVLQVAHAPSCQRHVIHLLDSANRAVRMRIAINGAGPDRLRECTIR